MDAVYYLAYIDYAQKKYDEALRGFQLANQSEKFAPLAPYYIADIFL